MERHLQPPRQVLGELLDLLEVALAVAVVVSDVVVGALEAPVAMRQQVKANLSRSPMTR